MGLLRTSTFCSDIRLHLLSHSTSLDLLLFPNNNTGVPETRNPTISCTPAFRHRHCFFQIQILLFARANTPPCARQTLLTTRSRGTTLSSDHPLRPKLFEPSLLLSSPLSLLQSIFRSSKSQWFRNELISNHDFQPQDAKIFSNLSRPGCIECH